MRLQLASTNPGKIAELRQILIPSGVELIELGSEATTQEIETGSTFTENALLKAHYYHRITGLPTIADDSGLEVDALDGGPGVYSARYGGPAASDVDRVNKLLEALKDVPPNLRGARFVCIAAIVWDGAERTFSGEANGRVLYAPRGNDGFGYDPIFFFEPLGRTFAELTASEKVEVSHRGLAFRKLCNWLSEDPLLDTSKPGDKIGNPTGDSLVCSQ
jgi:XTP/dITP diphosphohydrolase